jgi:hypothetical protein
MYPEGSCFGRDFIVNEVEVSCLMVVLPLGGAGAVSRSACLSGNGGIFWVLTTVASPDQHLLQFVLADHFRIESRSVVL